MNASMMKKQKEVSTARDITHTLALLVRLVERDISDSQEQMALIIALNMSREKAVTLARKNERDLMR